VQVSEHIGWKYGSYVKTVIVWIELQTHSSYAAMSTMEWCYYMYLSWNHILLYEEVSINNMEIKYFQPFGKRSGSVFDNRTLYKQVLLELARVVRCKGRAILLTYDRKSMTMVS
jgi:hypothetical protein